MESLERFLERREQSHARRRLKPVTRRGPGRVTQGGREYIDFSSNDYLGLSSHPELLKAARAALDAGGTSSSASRLMSGDLEIHHTLEEETAVFKGKESALVFNSGYQANVGVIPALLGRRDVVFADRLVHASIIDGIMLSKAEFFRFHHNDADHLAHLLARHRKDFENAMVITESVFSMDGDQAPLADMVKIKKMFDCVMFVDEAHATGVFGPQGRGLVKGEGLTEQVEFVMGTFSKALGGFGAYIAGSNTVVEYLINAARSFIYSTALPPSAIAVNLAAIRLCEGNLNRGPELLKKAKAFREMLGKAGVSALGSSQIVPVVVGGSEKAVRLSDEFMNRGFRVLPVRPPTVPEGQARLRFSLCYDHSMEDLKAVAEVLGELA